jgi:hypothetical protein
VYPLSKDAEQNLAFLVGKEICQIAIGSYDVQFHWGDGGISVWHKFLYKRAGYADQVVWVGDDPLAGPEAAALTIRLLKSSITNVKCSPHGTLQLEFSNGDEIEIFEDPQYESMSVQDGKRPAIIV